MAKIKISQLTAKGSNLANTDLLPIAEVSGLAYITKRVTGAQVGVGGSVTLTVGTTAIASGTIGRVFFQGTGNVLQQSANLFWDNSNGRLGIGTSTPDSPLNITRPVSASSGVARTVNVASTLTATANNDTLVAFDINPTFTNGAFTGVSNVALKVTGNSTFAGTTRITSGSNYIQTDANSGSAPFLSLFYGAVIDARIYARNSITLGAASMGSGIASFNAGSINYSSIIGSRLGATNGVIAVSNTGADAYMHIASPSGFSNFLYFRESGVADRGVVGYANGTSYMQIRTNGATNMTNGTLSTAFFANGNVGINTTTDAGFKLDVNGTARVQGNVAIGGTSFGTSSDKVLAQYTGIAPGSSPTDAFQMYSADIVGGNAAPHFRTENGNIVKIYQETTGVASATFVQNSGNRVDEVSTFDGYTIAQVVRALRNIGILA